ncbi:hypothetical protein GOC10_32380 [Sinorhizobium meliloti]|nr:hypothetical protein [Sinorhizobium meliloti]MDW9844615.1 hypothetical protein [Sinorhizobium meliloti]MDW9998911.1 hypothetical protein [Sinorhizobium meliloti]
MDLSAAPALRWQNPAKSLQSRLPAITSQGALDILLRRSNEARGPESQRDMQHVDPHQSGSAILAPLRNGVFRSIWTASQISSLGWLVQTVAIS